LVEGRFGDAGNENSSGKAVSVNTAGIKTGCVRESRYVGKGLMPKEDVSHAAIVGLCPVLIFGSFVPKRYHVALRVVVTKTKHVACTMTPINFYHVDSRVNGFAGANASVNYCVRTKSVDKVRVTKVT
jgi:hypothetical protein